MVFLFVAFVACLSGRLGAKLFLILARDLGRNMLETDTHGCESAALYYYVGILRYFGYSSVANAIIANSYERPTTNRKYCHKGTIDKVFGLTC